MLAWIIVIVLLFLLLILPVGVNLVYQQQLELKLRIGPLKLGILPKKPGEKQRKSKEKKEKVQVPKAHKKLHLTKDDYFELLRVVFKALARTRKQLSIDLLKLHWTAAADNPYDAVMQYGGLNAGLSALMPLAHSVLKIRNEDVRTCVDFEQASPQIEAELEASLQIWEILFTGNCALISIFSWYFKKKKRDRAARKSAEQKGTV